MRGHSRRNGDAALKVPLLPATLPDARESVEQAMVAACATVKNEAER